MNVAVLPIYRIEKIEKFILLQFKYSIEDVFPGQFFMIGPEFIENKDFILNRPFSVANFERGILEFRIRVTGKFTKWLLNCKKGEYLRLVGPLGKFVKNDFFQKYSKIILIGGGIGAVPLIFFADYLKKYKFDYKFIAGFPTKEELIYLTGVPLNDLTIFTEDGSYGCKGFGTDYLKSINMKDELIIACGPVNMYKELKKYEDKFNIMVLMEERMACGFGVCLGCVVETKNGYKRVCTDGPIFNLKELMLN